MVGYDELTAHPVVRRVSALGKRLRQFDAQHRWLLDAGGIVVVYLLAGVPDLIGPESLSTAAAPELIALQAGLVIPLLWRRRSPTITFYAIVTVFVVQLLLGVGLRADVALLIAVYNLALRERPTRLAWAGLTVVGAMILVAVQVRERVAVGDAFFVGLSVVTASAALAVAVRLRRAQLDSLRLRAAQLEVERDQRSRLSAVSERTRIAREMHDILGHNLSVIITLADGGARASTLEARRGTEALRLIGEVGRRALDDLRRVLGVLREADDTPERTPQPDIGAISGLCDQIRAAGPLVTYRTSGDLNELDPGMQLVAYRIAQEALTNCLGHAGPSTRIELALYLELTCLRITVADSGPADGYKPLAVTHRGQGLIGMRERAVIYGGTATAGPDPHGGWVVTATLPRPAVTTGKGSAS